MFWPWIEQGQVICTLSEIRLEAEIVGQQAPGTPIQGDGCGYMQR